MKNVKESVWQPLRSRRTLVTNIFDRRKEPGIGEIQEGIWIPIFRHLNPIINQISINKNSFRLYTLYGN
tara:strand:+ start:1004 stop:1210 length:207 start_codon:yes stop_codon:yes gene_type:complete